MFKMMGKNTKAFTIVELLVVIVVIGILAAVTIISYSGISQKATAATIQNDLHSISKQLHLFEVDNGFYPASINDCPVPAAGNMCLKTSSGNIYGSNDIDNAEKTFCITVKNGNQEYYITENDSYSQGHCSVSSVNILAVGGGGSGASSSNGGTGGMGGSVVSQVGYKVSNSKSIIVGNGGSAVASGNNGAAGGDSYFGTFRATGGSGGLMGNSDAAAASGTASSISGAATTYGGGGGSSNSSYMKTVGGVGGGGGGFAATAYGDGTKNLVSNGYAGLLYGYVNSCPAKAANAGNLYNMNAQNCGGVDPNLVTVTQHLPRNNGKGSYSIIPGVNNVYVFSSPIVPSRQFKVSISASGSTTAASLYNLYLNFNGVQKTITQAIADGYIEPMVLVNSAYSAGMAWTNILNVFSNTATSTLNYPNAGFIITLRGYALTGIAVNTNKAYDATWDGVKVESWDRFDGVAMSAIPKLSGAVSTGGGGGANTDGASGAGGSGVVIVSYPTGSVSATGGTITTSGGNTIHTFTSNGTFTIN